MILLSQAQSDRAILAKQIGISEHQLSYITQSNSCLLYTSMLALNIFIFVIVYGRMIEIYLLTSLAPIPVATLSNLSLIHISCILFFSSIIWISS